MLKYIFRFGLNEPIKSCLPEGKFNCSLKDFMDYALLCAGSSFTEERDIASVTEMADAPNALTKWRRQQRTIISQLIAISQVTTLLNLQSLFTSLLTLQSLFTSLLTFQSLLTSLLTFQSRFTSQLIIQSRFTSPLIIQSHFTSPLIIQSHFTSPLTIQNLFTSPLISQNLVTFCLPHPYFQG